MLSNLRLLNDNCSSRVFCVEIAEQLENVLGLTQRAWGWFKRKEWYLMLITFKKKKIKKNFKYE